MQADPASPIADDDGAGSGSSDEYGFELPVMSPEVTAAASYSQHFPQHSFSCLQSVERASFAKVAIESHYELLLKSAQVYESLLLHIVV